VTDWDGAMREALALAQAPDAPYGENPRVGCVLLAPDGEVVGRGYHRGGGTPPSEVVALADAGARAAGATAVVTLEPCRHTGRTGPCTRALIDAGVGAVVFGQPDPTEQAAGGGAVLRAAGLDVTGGVLAEEAVAVNEEWTFAVVHGRPFVTWKCAASLDGRVAGPDGGPTPITGPEARAQVHLLRARVGAIIVGTGTLLADDPQLTVRGEGEAIGPAPLRVVVGSRPIPAGARVLDDAAPTLVTAERDPRVLLATLYSRGVRHALLEGGPTLAAAFLAARVVDRVEWYVAPVVLGAGPVALPAPVPGAGALGVDVLAVDVVGEDVRVVGRVRYEEAGA
jgi:diaminohydroxyphosphoribosylaminopyrimidine deaminase / 5-amino-6-(5-phosphoribosylamino)uracil reductase